jgi:hypothetical protein
VLSDETLEGGDISQAGALDELGLLWPGRKAGGANRGADRERGHGHQRVDEKVETLDPTGWDMP